jgi:hypothetical protein
MKSRLLVSVVPLLADCSDARHDISIPPHLLRYPPALRAPKMVPLDQHCASNEESAGGREGVRRGEEELERTFSHILSDRDGIRLDALIEC